MPTIGPLSLRTETGDAIRLGRVSLTPIVRVLAIRRQQAVFEARQQGVAAAALVHLEPLGVTVLDGRGERTLRLFNPIPLVVALLLANLVVAPVVSRALVGRAAGIAIRNKGR